MPTSLKGACEGAHGLIGVFAVEQVHLLKGTAVRLDAAEAAHLDDDGSYALQLVLAGLEFTARLEHVAIDERKLNLSFFHCSWY